ncbi:hypothetical protein HXX76_001308 [Chlamydomonas incerta]|uniref:Membrane-associated protein n=1 Tax=Chlamydomonas incerta TaxID=51695 RepID=A0A836B1G3_CHLIN|nr:hypothetical protein HXX76_001308 [Chlamydomonas incerta]|eukprot:KAG2444563.1 hypothetical protein HXX76_001308 [Chlamydomonas incerta]
MARSQAAGAALVLLFGAAAVVLVMAPGASAGRLGASMASSAAQQIFQPRRALLAGSCGLSCSYLPTCITAACVATDGVYTTTVALNFTACKNATISWACCTGTSNGGSCSLTTCNGAPSNGTCNDVLYSVLNVTYGATSVTLQIHDGNLVGNTNCTARPCCAGSGGTTCPSSSALSAANIPNVACSTCTAVSTCFQEDNSNSQQFETDPARTVTAFFSLIPGGCAAKPTGTYSYTDPLFGPSTAPLYLMTDGVTALHTFLGYAAVGASNALACYTNTTYTAIDKYVYVTRIPTDTTNYACLTCSWFNLYTVSKPPNCVCRNDTAWAFPLKSVLTSWTSGQASSTSEILLPSSSYPGSVYWTARPDSSAWGGFFRFAPSASAPNRVTTTTTYAFDISTSTSLFFSPAPGASTSSAVLQVFQSYIAPPTFNPGQFKSFDTLSAVTTPFSYGTTFSVLKIATGTVNYGSASANVPTAMSVNGTFVAIHMSTDGYFCDGSPAYNSVLPQ